MPNLTTKAVATLLAASLVFAPVVGIAKANASPAACSGAYFGVGGYRYTDQVPPGYQPIHTPGGIFPWENGGYNHGQQVGANNVVRAVEDYVAACRTGDVHLYGYSYGAGVVHTAVGHIDGQPYAPRVHVYLMGNPRHPGGIEDSWRGVQLPGLAFRGPGHQPTRVASFVDRCNPRDAICDMPPWYNPIGTVDHIVGYFTGTHGY